VTLRATSRLTIAESTSPTVFLTNIAGQTRKAPERLKRGGCGIQRMTVDTWLNVIEREKLRSDGHIGPTGVGNLPRPQETGGCSCPTCTHNQAILDARASQSEFVP
jgi:hypothetical protein